MDIQTLAIAGQQYSNLKNYTDGAIQQAVVQSKETLFKKVTTLPDVNTAELGTIYYVPVEGAEDNSNMCDEYAVFVNGTTRRWEKIGRTGSLPTALSQLTNDANYVQDATYIHTDNNYTTTEKNKLAGITAGAEVNVQANWAEIDSTSDAYIQNKPSIYTQTEIDNKLVLCVTFTEDDEDIQCDTPFSTISNALLNNRLVYAQLISNEHEHPLFLVPGRLDPDDDEDITFVAADVHGLLRLCYASTGEIEKDEIRYYSKPKTGIPATDLAQGVQTSLSLADSALQQHQSLANYYTKTETDTLLDGKGTYSKPSNGIPATDLTSDIQTKLNLANAAVQDNAYVHTDNNYTTEEKTKLSGVASGAEVNVQANWTEVDSTSDAYIQNKPNLATVATSGSYADLANTPAIPANVSDLTNDLNFASGTYSKPSGGIPKSDLTSAIQGSLDLADTAVQPAALSSEASTRQTEDGKLQTQIDAINARADVVDVIADYNALLYYYATDLTDKDIIKVLLDSMHSDNTTYYRYHKVVENIDYQIDNNSVIFNTAPATNTLLVIANTSHNYRSQFYTCDGTTTTFAGCDDIAEVNLWTYIGAEGASYTKAAVDEMFTDVVYSDELADVATSGAYADLSGTPVLATVATSGNYSDLTLPQTGIPASDLASGVQTSLDLADSAIQSSDLATIATTGDYSDLTLPQTGIPKTDLASGVQTSLGKADTAVQDANYVHTDNNYTTTEKTKLSGIAEGAEVNVQADWNVTDNTSDAYIQNKPLVDSTLSTSSTNAVQNGVVTTELNKKYVKPATGIPVSDLSSEAQNILTAADNVEISATTTQNGISVTVTDSTGTDTTVYVTNGEKGDRGEPFAIYATYPTIAAMNADAANVPNGKFVMIAAVDNDNNPDPENPDNSKLYAKIPSGFDFITDLSGEQGIQGVAGGHFTPSVSSAGDLTWTYNSNASNNTTPPTLVNIKGPQGETYELTAQDKDDIAAIALEIEYSEKQLYFENTSIAAADWEQTFTYDGYSYSVDLELPGLTESMIPEVYFSGSAILQFNYFPLANIHEVTKNNETKVVLTIYAAQPEAVIIPTIKCEMTDYEELSIANGGNS